MNNRISWSRMNTYRSCPAQYNYKYNEGWKAKFKKDAAEFGKVFEKAIMLPWAKSKEVSRAEELEFSLQYFDVLWGRVEKDPTVRYGKKFNWSDHTKIGHKMIRDFYSRFRERIGPGKIQVEMRRPIPDRSGSDGYGWADFIGEIDGFSPTYLDIKTSANPWQKERIDRDGQTANYAWLARHNPDKPYKVAYLIGVKTKGGYCELEVRDKEKEDLSLARRRYQRHIEVVASDVDFDRVDPDFIGNPCNICDVKAVCFGQKELIKSDLAQITK